MSHPWKDLLVWQKAHSLVIDIYKAVSHFPDTEKFCLSQQIRRSAVSIAANIVEGKSKKTDKEFTSFLFNSRGSLEETRYHLLLARDLGFINNEKYEDLENQSIEISYLLNRLIESVSK